MKWKSYIFTIIIGFCFILSLLTDWYRFLTITLMIALIVMVLDKLGKGIVLRELMALHMGFICLFMPFIGYTVYTRNHPLALLWVRYMNIPEETYFGFCLPAVSGFVLAICWPMLTEKASDQGRGVLATVEKSKSVLGKIPNVGFLLIVSGLVVFGVSDFLPVELQFAFLLFFFAAFAGLLYVYYQPNFKRKFLILSLFGAFIVAESLSSGMFTIIAYMGITLFSFFFVGKKISFWKKLTVFAASVIFLFTIQSVKLSYRKYTWRQDYEGSKIGLFGTLIKEQASVFSDVNFSNVFFPIYYRANQGINVSLVMNRFPNYQEFDNGKNLSRVILSSFVPRVFWPDKPEAGGKANMRHYTGYIIEGWSTNVGPLGEAYGSFGVMGGILYMIGLGAFVRWSYRIVFVISRRLPLILFWIPVLFYQVTYSAEADTLQIMNSIIKSSFFVWLLFKFSPKLFGVAKHHFGISKNAMESLRKEAT